MPMVRRPDQDDIQVLLLKHLVIIRVGARSFFGLLPLADHLGGFGQQMLIDITQGYDFHRRNLNKAEQVALSIPAGADEANAFRLLINNIQGLDSQRGKGQRGRGRLQESAASTSLALSALGVEI